VKEITAKNAKVAKQCQQEIVAISCGFFAYFAPFAVEKLGGYALLCRLVIQVLSKPALDFANVHAFALTVIGNLITLNFAEIEIT
jgi:hypothetical protein